MKRLLFLAVFLVALNGSAARAGAYRFLGKSVDDWRKALTNRDAATRRSAAFALGRMGEDAAPAVLELVRRLRDDNAGVRDMAATALGDIARALKAGNDDVWQKSGGTLVQVLKEDQNERVRRSAAYALGCFGPKASGATENLMQALADDKPSVVQNAAWALGRIGTAAGDAVEKLCDCLSNKDALVRRDVAGALGAMGKAGVRGGRPLMEMLKSEKDDVVKKTALDALAHLAGPEHKDAAADLTPLLEEKDPEIRLGAALVLARVGGDPAARGLPVLRRALKDPDAHTQEMVTAALANLGPDAKPAMHDLAETLNDENNSVVVRRNAALALAHIGEDAEPVVPALVKALRRNQPTEVRQFAAEALAQMRYPANEKGVPAMLESIEKDDDQMVRQKCVWALFGVKSPDDMHRLGADVVLEKVLSERGEKMALVRYDAARKLANVLGSDAPDKTVDVLLEMLTNKTLNVYNRTDATVQGVNTEAGRGKANVEANLGGDARYMAVQALGWLGDKAGKRKEVVDAIRKAAADKDDALKKAAEEALEKLGVKK